jgi:hypothetical protein
MNCCESGENGNKIGCRQDSQTYCSQAALEWMGHIRANETKKMIQGVSYAFQLTTFPQSQASVGKISESLLNVVTI